MAEAGRAAEQRKQRLALLQGRDRLARPPDRQDAVPPALVIEAACDEIREVAVADRLAGGEAPVAEEQEGLARPHAPDLPRERLEEGGRPDDRVAQPRCGQRRLEGELRLLEGQQRPLNADGGQQHEMRDARLPGSLQQGQMRPVIDGPGVGGRARARRHAGHQRVETLSREHVAHQCREVRRIDHPNRCAGRRFGPSRWARPHDTDHLMPPAQQRRCRGPADRPGRADETNPLAPSRGRLVRGAIGGRHGLRRVLRCARLGRAQTSSGCPDQTPGCTL